MGREMGCPGKKAPLPCQLSLHEKKKQGLFSLLPSLFPGLQLLVRLERLQYIGGGGSERREDSTSQIWDPSPSSKLVVGEKQFAKEIFNAAGRSFGSSECTVCTLKKKSVLVAKIQTCVGAQLRLKKKKS